MTSCFSAKIVFISFVCFATCLFYINMLNTISWKKMLFKEAPTHTVNINVNLKNNIVLANGTYQTIQEVTQCYDRTLNPLVQLRGNFWVLYNYVPAENQHRCFESVTYTTQGDYTFVDNVIVVVERWQGPVSVALHTPGDDFQPTLDSIAYLRNCETDLIKQYVTFHLFFSTEHMPNITSIKALKEIYEDTYDCSQAAPYLNKDYKGLYRTRKKLTYPINVARNIARTTAQTHFVLAADIELYPSPNLILKFLQMVARKRELFEDRNPKIFVLPVFEVLANKTIPQNKTVLQTMVNTKTAFYFHQRLCRECHGIPYASKWLDMSESDDLDIFATTKRQGKFAKWEAFYIGTKEDPLFDERLSWEGQSNKMIQAYAMCLLDYDYMVLNNAFLVHKPGVKKGKTQNRDYFNIVSKTNKLISTQIKYEINLLYGERAGCIIR